MGLGKQLKGGEEQRMLPVLKKRGRGSLATWDSCCINYFAVDWNKFARCDPRVSLWVPSPSWAIRDINELLFCVALVRFPSFHLLLDKSE
jgi:hypothetical protein